MVTMDISNWNHRITPCNHWHLYRSMVRLRDAYILIEFRNQWLILIHPLLNNLLADLLTFLNSLFGLFFNRMLSRLDLK